MIAVSLTLKTKIYPLFLLLIGIAGFFVVAQSTAALSFAAEATFPVESAMVNGVLNLFGNSVSALVGIGLTKLTAKS